MDDRTCLVLGCSDLRYGRQDWCKLHYQRAYRHNGDPLGGRTPNGEAAAYFWAHVDDVLDQCNVWPYVASGGGYGQFRSDGREQYVHVLACERHHGPKPEPGMVAIHAPVICHDRLCFNWRHLSWGTYQQNSDDTILDETRPFGEQRHNAKLTWEKVTEIRARYAAGGISQQALANEYGVSVTPISKAINLRTWKEGISKWKY